MSLFTPYRYNCLKQHGLAEWRRIPRAIIRQIIAFYVQVVQHFRRTWNLILNFFSLLILVVHTLSLNNPSDATLQLLSISIYPRWRPRWRQIISEKIIWCGKMSQTHFSLKLLAMKLESNSRDLAYNKNIKNKIRMQSKWPAKWQFITRI